VHCFGIYLRVTNTSHFLIQNIFGKIYYIIFLLTLLKNYIFLRLNNHDLQHHKNHNNHLQLHLLFLSYFCLKFQTILEGADKMFRRKRIGQNTYQKVANFA
jgi:hypothetical protein